MKNAFPTSIVALSLFVLSGCNEPDANWDARTDPVLDKPIARQVIASIETDPVEAAAADDSADDPAIWIHPKDRSLSLVIGTNKKSGLLVYSLDGTQIKASQPLTLPPEGPACPPSESLPSSRAKPPAA